MAGLLRRLRAGRDRRRRAQPQAVANQEVGGQKEEQQQALEHAGDGLRQADHNLRRLAADVGERHQQAGEDDAERVQAAEEGDDDGGEAVARRDHRSEEHTSELQSLMRNSYAVFCLKKKKTEKDKMKSSRRL